MPLTGFEPAIPGGERPQTHALDHAVTGTGDDDDDDNNNVDNSNIIIRYLTWEGNKFMLN